MYILILTILAVTIVSLIAFMGIIFVRIDEKKLQKVTTLLVGFASGSLLGSAFLHLIPEALSAGNDPMMPLFYVLLGLVFFFIMEKFLYWRHCHVKSCPTHAFVYLNLIGDGIHNFLDGMIIAATFLISIDLGFTTTLAVIFHEIPQEIGDFGVLIYGGLSRKKALMFNFISAITAITGALLVYVLADFRSVEAFLVPLAAGGFIYIAATDLLPELHKRSNPDDSIVQFIVFLVGLLLMAYFKITFEG